VGVALFERLGIMENLFLSWLEDFLRAGVSLARADAEELGEFISRQRWATAATRVADAIRRHRRNDLLPAAMLVTGLLDLFTRLHLSFLGTSHGRGNVEDWWSALADVTTELYRYGPRDRDVWERAGGDPAELDLSGDGRQRWRAALWMLRQGGGGKITGDMLVAEMLLDFPKNEKLQMLHQVRMIGG
jgi:hypothetical protein